MPRPTDSGSGARPKKVVRRRSSLGTLAQGVQRAAASKPVSKPPRTDVQTSGPGYGVAKADQFKKTPVYKRSVGAAKPSRQSDVTSSGGDYGVAKANRFKSDVLRNAVEHEHYVGIGPAKVYTHSTYTDPFTGKDVTDARNAAFATGRQGRLSKSQVVGQNVIKATTAPALKVLEATTIPVHAIAGTALGKGPAYGIRHKTGFKQVLKAAGAPKFVQSVGGFALDVAADPTTYTTFGAGAVAKKAAQDAAEQASVKALKAGMSEAGARTVAKQAAKRAAEAAHPGTGVTVKFAGHEVPAVRSVTAKAGSATRSVAGKAPKAVKSVAGTSKDLVGDFRPTLTPSGADPGQYVAARQAARSARSATTRAHSVAEAQARGLKKQVGEANYAQVIDAVEKGRIGKLPSELRQPAIALRSANRFAKRQRMRAGIPEGKVGKSRPTRITKVERFARNAQAKRSSSPQEVLAHIKEGEQLAQQLEAKAAKRQGAAKEYVTHAQQTPLAEGSGLVTRDVKPMRGATRMPGTSKVRKGVRPISEQNPERVAQGRDPFSTDLPLLHVNYGSQTAKSVNAGELEKGIAAAGTELRPKIVTAVSKKGKVRVKRSYDVPSLKPNEQIFHAGYTSGKQKSAYMLRPLNEADVRRGVAPKNGKLVVLDKRTVEAARRYGKPTQAESTAGRVFDKATRTWKVVATATPGFHFRNLVGDTQLAYLYQRGHRLPGNMLAARKAVKGLNAQRRAVGGLVHDTTPAGTIKVAGKPLEISKFLRMAEAHGVTQSGYLTRELHDLAATDTKAAFGKQGRITAARHATGRAISQNRVVKAITQDRENLVRLSTFKEALDRGLSPADAADVAMSFHIDYADLTEVERKYMRRLMPFYTFSARALPRQAKSLVTTPGKFATLEKVRENFGTTNVTPFSTYTQRNVPLVVGGKAYTDSLPLTLLNELPTTTNPGKFGTELGQFLINLVNPIIKDPVELYGNYNFGFRNQIQDPKHPLVAAPDWVGVLPGPFKRELGVTKMLDGRTGKRVWAWPGKVDYKVRAVMPGPGNIVNQLAKGGTNRLGQDRGQGLIGQATGVKITPGDVLTQDINHLYDKLNGLTEKQAALGQQGIHAKNATPAYTELAGQIRQVEQQIYQVSKQRGDKKLPKAGAPRKNRVVRPSLGGGLGGGGVGGGLGGGLGG